MYFLLENMCFLRIVKISDVFFRKIGDPHPIFRRCFHSVSRRFNCPRKSCFRQHPEIRRTSAHRPERKKIPVKGRWTGKEKPQKHQIGIRVSQLRETALTTQEKRFRKWQNNGWRQETRQQSFFLQIDKIDSERNQKRIVLYHFTHFPI